MTIDMKKILIPALLFGAAFLTACSEDLLEVPQKGVVYEDDFYKTDADCEGAMVAAYQGLLYNVCSKEGASIYAPFRACFDLPGDDLYAAGNYFGDNDFMRAMNEYTYDTTTEVMVNCYKNIYYAMYYSNLVIAHFENGLPDGTKTATTKRCVAEARVLRAWMQMMLTIGWGCPGIVDHPLTWDEAVYRCDEDPNTPMSHEQMLVWCAEECEKAIPDLTERESATDKAGAVKVTTGFANAVAGKAYLFAGEYAKAKTALGKVIASEKYELVPGERWEENFHANGDCNEEKIFELNLETSGGLDFWDVVNRSTWMESQIWGWRADHFVKGGDGQVGNDPWTTMAGIDGWGGLGVPKAFADEFLANDGANSIRFKASLVHIADAVYNTHYNHPVDDMTLEQKKASKAFGIKQVGLYGQSFYLAKKQAINMSDGYYPGANVRVNNFVIMRYAEVLLMYAEACTKAGDADGKGLEALQSVQRRVNSNHVSTALTLDEVKKEKKFELWLEMCRWPDLVRWGDTAQVEKAGTDVPVLYDKLFRPVQSSDQGVIWENGTEANSRFYTVSTHEAKDRGMEVGFKKNKHEYFPFPDMTMRQNPTLNQLPGWAGK